MRNRLIIIMISLLALVFDTVSLNAGTTGKISGVIKDAETNQPLAGTNVIIEGTVLGAASDANGYYRILNVPPGSYVIKISMIGYRIYREQVRIRVDLTTQVNVNLEQSTIEGEMVSVVAEKSRLQLDITSTQATISSEEMELMPVEEFEQVLSLKAGVVLGSDGEIHVRGGRAGEITYMIDGVPVTDNYSTSVGVEIEYQSIAELQLITGTFDAEYGQAQSAVVNIITKEGNFSKYGGRVEANFGGFYTEDRELFQGINDISFTGIKDYLFTFNGPVISNKLSFFSLVRYKDDQGYLFGKRKYLPDSFYYNTDSVAWVPTRVEFDTTFIAGEISRIDTIKTTNLGDGALVAMNPSTQISGELKFAYKLTPRIKIRFDMRGSRTEFKSYTHKFRYNPDGDYQYHDDNNNIIIGWDQSLSSSTFFNLRYSKLYKNFRYFYNEDPTDSSAYNVDPVVFNAATGFRYYFSGIRMENYNRITENYILKADFVSQITNEHKLKFGIEFKKDRVSVESFAIQYNQVTNFTPIIPYPSVPGYENSISYEKYLHRPSLLGLYAQDKIEYHDIVLNLGLRFERFDPDGIIPNDPEDTNINDPFKPKNKILTLEEREAFWFRDAKVKYQWSPRIGVAHKISDRGSVHFSYGHFLQIPLYQFLYSNSSFKVPAGAGTTMGNADLDPERTVQYEVGLQQQLTTNVTMDVTGFYKDVRGLLDTEIHNTFRAGNRYALYINRDYSNVRGITFTVTKVGVSGVTGAIDYTYSVAEGNASDPNSAFFDVLDGRAPEKQLVFLDWDQPHTLNLMSSFTNSNRDLGLTFIGRYSSGLPYTRSYQGIRTAFENSGRRPTQYNLDMRSFKAITIGGLKMTMFLNIYNVFDRRNERNVYPDTGRSNYSLISTYTQQDQGLNTLDEYLRRPDFYTAPRSYKLGFRIAF